jgi:septal ring factor EnvC (AmiA/AmiB activator)
MPEKSLKDFPPYDIKSLESNLKQCDDNISLFEDEIRKQEDEKRRLRLLIRQCEERERFVAEKVAAHEKKQAHGNDQL